MTRANTKPRPAPAPRAAGAPGEPCAVLPDRPRHGGGRGTRRPEADQGPLIGAEAIGLAGNPAVFSFIVALGLAKTLTNLAARALTARFRRRQLLLAGWLIGAPVPFVLAWAPSWRWIVAANVLLGVDQGLTWSMTVNMKIDPVGPSRRGLATGLNEAAGYVAIGATALRTGCLAARYGLRPAPNSSG
ncbi:MFS transporter [Streptomyces sp. NPDC004284]|uniref:MFS transporter n=1 Tax=Streptomyces sp. NPDC004284 TaxID=3364695 RepID=UPI0036B1DDFC